MAIKRVSEKKLVVSPGAAKAPSARKAAPSKRTARSTAPDSSISSTTQTPSTSVFGNEAALAVLDAPREAVAALAYSYWVARGCEDGSPEEDWLRAERELGESLAVVTYSKATA